MTACPGSGNSRCRALTVVTTQPHRSPDHAISTSAIRTSRAVAAAASSPLRVLCVQAASLHPCAPTITAPLPKPPLPGKHAIFSREVERHRYLVARCVQAASCIPKWVCSSNSWLPVCPAEPAHAAHACVRTVLWQVKRMQHSHRLGGCGMLQHSLHA